jgi:glutamate synthase domain-containing protein 1
MCGIVGFLPKSGDNAIIGRVVLNMLSALACRGPDSAGVALYGVPQPGRVVMRANLGDSGDLSKTAGLVKTATQPFYAADFAQTGVHLRLTVADGNGSGTGPVIRAIEEASPGVEVVSMGRALEVMKQVGSPANLESTFGISKIAGTHGLGHTRLSTESIVDLSHSQPFWGQGRLDLAIVHNGHITNYHQLRRRYEQHGIRFYTENDSEIVAIYLAERLGKGTSLEDAFDEMMRDLDGSFSCVAATALEIGFIKDPFAFKPLVFAETESFVAIATEEVAIRAALPGDYQVSEAQVKEARVWRVHR